MNFPVHPDFTLVSGEERARFILNVIQKHNVDISEVPPAQINLITQYLLFGLRKDGSTCIGRNGSYFVNSRTTPNVEDQPPHPANYTNISIDELTDSTDSNSSTTGETAFAPIAHMDGTSASPPTRYIIPKKAPKWKELYSDHPAFQELFYTIDRLRYILAIYDGKDPLPPEDIPEEELDILRARGLTITTAEATVYRRMLIEVQRDQYVLQESISPKVRQAFRQTGDIFRSTSDVIDWNGEDSCFAFLPLGLLYKESPSSCSLFYNNCYPKLPDYNFEPAEFSIDFRDYKHVATLIKSIPLLSTEKESQNSNCSAIIDTINFYAEAALQDVPKLLDICHLYMRAASLDFICTTINAKYDSHHNTTYISALFTKACKEIAEYAQYHYQEYKDRKNKLRWQRCTWCGRILLRHERNFSHRNKSITGYINVCHSCERKRQAQRKAVKEGEELPPLSKPDESIFFLPYKEENNTK